MSLHSSLPRLSLAGPAARGSWQERLFRRAVFGSLRGLRTGRLVIREGGQRHVFGDASPAADPRAEVTVRDPGCYLRVALGGTIGAGEAYMDGDFACDDLVALVRLFVVNREVMNRMEGGLAWLMWPLHLLAHRRNGHDRAGDRRNIAAHYDLGDDFFALFLDRDAMMYSAAMFPHPEASLEEAALAKLEAICRKLELKPGDHVLEIGSGWGGFAIHAATHYGVRVTTTTISPAQYAYTRRRVEAAGLGDRITVLREDYRDLSGSYDKLVSIEMIEAIGHRQFGTFFAACDRLLRPGGRMALQAITIAEPFYEQARRTVDFIQRYIFPGGCLPAVSVLCERMGSHSDLRLQHLEEIGAHYATTLRHWRQRVNRQRRRIRGLGYDERFLRMWEFYLCYCEGGFMEGSIGTVQMVMDKPQGPTGDRETGSVRP